MTGITHQARGPAVLRTCLSALACIIVSSAAHPSPQPASAETVHFCLPLDLEETQVRDSVYAASKQALNLNVGPPRTVRMIYFLPNDRPFRASVVDSMKRTIRRIQTFYGEQMQAHGHGYKTFAVESDASGEPIVHRVDGIHPDSRYLDNTYRAVLDEVETQFDMTENIYFISIDNSIKAIDNRGNKVEGVGIRIGKNGGYGLFPGEFRRIGTSWRVTVHEMGHAFGLRHDFRDDEYIMSYGVDASRLSGCGAEFLVAHPYFNPNVETSTGSPPKVELISTTHYPAGAKNVAVQLRLSDLEGLHQVILFVRTRGLTVRALEVKSCRGFANQRDAVVEFDYDGVIPYNASTSDLSNPSAHPIFADAVDTDGNVSRLSFWLWEISQKHIATLEGHTRYVQSVAFSPNGKLFASASSDSTIKLWDVRSRRNSATIKHTHPIHSVACSPDGTTLAFGSSDKAVHLWDVATQRNTGTLGGHRHWISSVAFSPDRMTLASASVREVKLWNVGSRRNVATLEHTYSVDCVAFSPDGKTIATGSWGGSSSSDAGSIWLWDVSARRNIATLEGHSGRVTSVAFSPDGKTLASGSDDETVKIWNVVTRTIIDTFEGHRSRVRSVAYSPDGTTIASGSEGKYSGSWDNAVKLWDVATGKNVATYRHVDNISSTYNSPWIVDRPSGHAQPVYSVAFSPDGMILASVARPSHGKGTVILFDVSEWTRRRPQSIEKISGENQRSSVGSELAKPFEVEVRDQNGNPLQGIQVTFVVITGNGRFSGDSTVKNMSTDANGRATVRLTLGAKPGTTVVVATVAGLDAVTFSAVATGSVNGPINSILRGHSRAVRSVAFSPSGKMIASGSADRTIILWDVATRRNIRTLQNGGLVQAVAFSPNGRFLASHSNQVILWEVATGRKIATLLRTYSYGSVAFSPDGAIVAAGSPDNKVRLWEVSTRREIATLVHGEIGPSLHAVAFSPTRPILASGSQDGMIKLWNVSTGGHIATLESHSGSVFSVAFSPDGATLASAGITQSSTGDWDSTVELWDVEKKQIIATLDGHSDWIRSVAFSPDSTMLASGSYDNTVRLWDVTTKKPITTLSGHASRVHSIAFSPDGGTLVSGGEDNEIRLWDVSQYTSAVPPSAGSNADAVLALDLIPDGGAANQVNDGVTSGTVSVKDTKIAVEVFATGVKTRLLGLHVRFDFDPSLLDFVKAENSAFSLSLPDSVGTYFSATAPVTLAASGFLARGEFRSIVDVTRREFSIGIKSVKFAESETLIEEVTTTGLISFNSTPPPATFSLSVDGNAAAGDQGLTMLDVGTGSVVPIQLFGNDIRGVNGVSVRFEYDAAQVGYDGFDPGVVLPNAQVLAVPATNPTAIDISVVSFGGQVTVDSGLVGRVRFLTTDEFSGTTLRLVSAEIGRGDKRESITPSDVSVMLRLAKPTPDFNGDGRVDFGDFVAFGMHFGASRGDARYDAKYDLDQDGTIGFGDFLIFGREFGSGG